jgi:hypothetical protein
LRTILDDFTVGAHRILAYRASKTDIPLTRDVYDRVRCFLSLDGLGLDVRPSSR